MNIFKRLFKIGEAETHSVIDKLEDPIKMVEQGIRDMKSDLDKSLKSLAEVKSIQIRRKNELNQLKEKEKSYQNKSILLLNKTKSGDLEMPEAERLVKENLKRVEALSEQIKLADGEVSRLNSEVLKLENSIGKLKSDISKWENEAKTLNARIKVSSATKKINKQMAGIDSSSVTNMLERMKGKVIEEESLSEAYGDIAGLEIGHDEEVNNALKESNYDDELEKLKNQLGLNDQTPSV